MFGVETEFGIDIREQGVDYRLVVLRIPMMLVRKISSALIQKGNQPCKLWLLVQVTAREVGSVAVRVFPSRVFSPLGVFLAKFMHEGYQFLPFPIVVCIPVLIDQSWKQHPQARFFLLAGISTHGWVQSIMA